MNLVFSSYISGIGKRYANYSLIDESEMSFSYDNIQKLYNITEFSVEGIFMRFFESGESGFIAKPAIEIIPNILQQHKKLVQEIGVISDLYGFTNIYLQNLVELFSCDKDSQNVDLLIEDFHTKYSKNQFIEKKYCQNQLSELVTFAYEANGNRFMYNSQGKVFLYGMDHSYKDLVQVSGYPEFTLYQVKEFQNFDDFMCSFFIDNQ